MKNIILAAAVSLLPVTAFADGHSTDMAGLASPVSSDNDARQNGFNYSYDYTQRYLGLAQGP